MWYTLARHTSSDAEVARTLDALRHPNSRAAAELPLLDKWACHASMHACRAHLLELGTGCGAAFQRAALVSLIIKGTVQYVWADAPKPLFPVPVPPSHSLPVHIHIKS